MKKTRKLLCMVLALAMVLGCLAGCSDSGSAGDTAKSTQAAGGDNKSGNSKDTAAQAGDTQAGYFHDVSLGAVTQLDRYRRMMERCLI